nr:DNA polymerase IV [Promineifilum sp.]
MSVDEAYIDLSGAADPAEIARDIRERIPVEMRLPASVGLATGKLVAKVASDFNKPRGLMIVLPGEEAAFLAPQPARAIWGIGPRTAERLAALGINTCGELAAADPDRLRAAFGRDAESLMRRARGEDDRPVEPDRGPPKSISQDWTFNRDVAGELSKRNLLAHTVRVKFRTPDFTTFTRQRSLGVGTDDEETIYRVALALWQENWPAGRPMRLLGVGAASLVAGEGRQLGLF